MKNILDCLTQINLRLMMMIRNCEEIKTRDNFEEFSILHITTKRIGLKETSELIMWDYPTLMDPVLFQNLYRHD